jgi:hypothetical protein
VAGESGLVDAGRQGLHRQVLGLPDHVALLLRALEIEAVVRAQVAPLSGESNVAVLDEEVVRRPVLEVFLQRPVDRDFERLATVFSMR